MLNSAFNSTMPLLWLYADLLTYYDHDFLICKTKGLNEITSMVFSNYRKFIII